MVVLPQIVHRFPTILLWSPGLHCRAPFQRWVGLPVRARGGVDDPPRKNGEFPDEFGILMGHLISLW